MTDETPKELFFEGDDLRLHCLDWGSQGARPLLLLHGLRDCARSWDLFSQAMSPDHHVVALDGRGHGDSGWAAQGRYTFAHHVGDVGAAVDHMGFSEVVLVGHGAGGRYAWSYAAENPARVSALVVLDVDPDPMTPRTQRDFDAYRSESAVWDSIDAVVDTLRRRQTYTSDEVLQHQANHLTHQVSDGKLVWKSDPRVMGEYERPDLWESWRRISCPTLILRGRQSTVLTHEIAVRMREALPGEMDRLAELDGGGHWFYQDFPGAFHSTVRWFLEGLSDQGAAL
jgi:pimeloyl-ACP methyl ester carboxylesterase